MGSYMLTCVEIALSSSFKIDSENPFLDFDKLVGFKFIGRNIQA